MNRQRGYMAVALGLNYAAMMSLAVAVNLTPVFLTTFSHDLGGAAGLTNEQLGRVSAVTFVGLVLGVALTGPLADRWGAKVFAVSGNLLLAAGLAVLGLAPNYEAVLAAVFIMGLGAGVLDMILSPIVSALQPESRTSSMNWLHSFYCIGAVATVLIAAAGINSNISWRTISLWMILMPLPVGLGFICLRIPPLIAGSEKRTRLRHLCRNHFFLVSLVAIFLAGATELGMAQWLPAYAEKSLHYSKWTGGMALLAFSIAMAVGRIAAGMLGSKISALSLMLHCCWTSIVLFIIGCFAPVPAVALAACVLAGLTGSCLWPSMLAVAADRFPAGGASMFGLLAALGNFGGIFMPWVVGVTADHAPMRWGLATATLCPLLLGVLLVWMKRRPQEPMLELREVVQSHEIAEKETVG